MDINTISGIRQVVIQHGYMDYPYFNVLLFFKNYAREFRSGKSFWGNFLFLCRKFHYLCKEIGCGSAISACEPCMVALAFHHLYH